VVEFLDHIIPGADEAVSSAFRQLLEKRGFAFRMSTKVDKAGFHGVTRVIAGDAFCPIVSDFDMRRGVVVCRRAYVLRNIWRHIIKTYAAFWLQLESALSSEAICGATHSP
jgi:hypothetical protein